MMELQLILNDLREKYDAGEPIVSDYDYDILMELAVYEGEIRSSSEDTSYGERVQHPIDIMRGTLDKVYYLSDTEPRTNKSRRSLSEWIQAKREVLMEHGIDIMKEDVIVTAKYDGLSCCLYVDGKGNPLWLTRGDTDTNHGVDIGHIMNILSVPLVPNTATQFELLIENDRLVELNERYSTTYKNTRALTAGIVHTKETDFRAQFIRPIPLKLYADGKLVIHPDQIAKYPSIKCKLGDIDQIRAFAESNRYVFRNLRTDGAVITLINPKVQQILGRKDNINQFEVAYKFTEEASYSIVQNIIFQVSELGSITPVLEISPIVMKGNTIRRISLHNKTRFDQLNLHYQDTIKVLYDIIPYCTMDAWCDKNNATNKNIAIPFPTECPICGKKLDLSHVLIECTNPSCPSKKVGRMINYLVNLNCKGIGPETVRRLSEIGVISDIPTLYHIGSTKQMRVIMNTHGFGELKLKMILGEIRKITTLNDCDFFGSLGFKGLNKQFFKLIFAEYDVNRFIADINDKKWDSIRSQIGCIKGIGPKKSEILVKMLKSDRKLIQRCLNYVKIRSTFGSSGEIKGVVFTGFRDQSLREALESKGYTYQDNVTSSTALVIAKDPQSNSGSIKKATARGIPVMGLGVVKTQLAENISIHHTAIDT